MKNRALVFVVSVYILTALYSLIYLVFPVDKKDLISFVVTAFYMFIPFLTALLLQKFVYKEKLSEAGIVIKWSPWFIPAALAPLFIALLAFGISLLMPGISFDPSMTAFMEKIGKNLTPEQFEKAKQSIEPIKQFFIPIILAQAIFAGVTINALFSFGEEAGWRGFLLNALKEKNFFYASAVIGIVWGIWHAPIILQGHNYPEHRVAGVFMMTAFTVLLTPIMIYFTKKSGSVIAAALFHGVMNASAGVTLMYIRGGNDLTAGLTGFSGFIALALADLFIVIYDLKFSKNKILF